MSNSLPNRQKRRLHPLKDMFELRFGFFIHLLCFVFLAMVQPPGLVRITLLLGHFVLPYVQGYLTTQELGYTPPLTRFRREALLHLSVALAFLGTFWDNVIVSWLPFEYFHNPSLIVLTVGWLLVVIGHNGIAYLRSRETAEATDTDHADTVQSSMIASQATRLQNTEPTMSDVSAVQDDSSSRRQQARR